MESSLVYALLDTRLSDSMFTTASSDAMTNARLNRVEGAIPYIRRANQVYSSSAVKAPSQNAVNPVMKSAGDRLINPNSGLQAVGNTSPFVMQGKFNFTATPTSITLFWDGTNGSQIFVIKRADGTSFTIPGGSLLISGLTPLTTYGFLPYNCITSQNNLSFSMGDAGNPQFAFSPSAPATLISLANQNQQAAVNEAITTGFIYFATTAGGTATGSGAAGDPSPYTGQNEIPAL